MILCLIPTGWKRTMTCANFKPLEASMEELVKYLEGVERLEIKSLPDRNPRKNNSDGPKSSKKNCRTCELCKMYGGNAESHSTERCNKKTVLASLLDGHKKKRTDKAKKEEFCAMAKAFKKANLKSKKSCKRSAPD
eukprot:14463702-Ditylum_brightwellii.AAC.1